jgi:anti-anti-sigma regulatory factor
LDATTLRSTARRRGCLSGISSIISSQLQCSQVRAAHSGRVPKTGTTFQARSVRLPGVLDETGSELRPAPCSVLIVLWRAVKIVHTRGIDAMKSAMADQSPDVQLERPGKRVAVVSFTGEHDLATCDTTRRLLTGLIDENRLVVADFSRASFVDGSIVDVLRDAGRHARERGSGFRLQLETVPVVAMMFQASGVLDELECASTREDALSDPSARRESLADDLGRRVT